MPGGSVGGTIFAGPFQSTLGNLKLDNATPYVNDGIVTFGNRPFNILAGDGTLKLKLGIVPIFGIFGATGILGIFGSAGIVGTLGIGNAFVILLANDPTDVLAVPAILLAFAAAFNALFCTVDNVCAMAACAFAFARSASVEAFLKANCALAVA